MIRVALGFAVVVAAAFFAAPCGGGRLAAAPRGRDLDVPVDGQRLQHDADERERHGQEPVGQQLRARVDDDGAGQRPTRRRAPARSPSRRRTSASSTPTGRARRRRLVPDPVRRRSRIVRQQPREHVLQRDLGRAGTRARRAGPEGHELGRDGRRAERRRELERLSRHRVGHRAGVPDKPVIAAKIRSQITQAGALGDPYGSGVRTIWWVYGVGPVKVVFQHAGGSGAPVTTAVLQATNQTPQRRRRTSTYFPLEGGLKGTYRWTNTKLLQEAGGREVQRSTRPRTGRRSRRCRAFRAR